MNSCNSSRTQAADEQKFPIPETAYERVRQTATFRNGRFDKWSGATIGVVGLGLLGSRLALEAVRSGAAVWVCDPNVGSSANFGNQLSQPGVAKTISVVQACEAIRPRCASGVVADIRHIGIGMLRKLRLLVDCTDDPMLAQPLTGISNGLGIPLLRCAVDGSGESDMGRVLCSDGGTEAHSCQLCNYSAADLWRARSRTPCPGGLPEGPLPTLAGGAVGMVIAGVGLLQAQRLITGNDTEAVFNREILLDLSHGGFHSIRQSRSSRCLSGHVRWDLTPLGTNGSVTTLAEIFDFAGQQALEDVSVEPYEHPLKAGAICDCGHRQAAYGTRWAEPPQCRRCGHRTAWADSVPIDRITESMASEVGVLEVPLKELGFPCPGAMFVLRHHGDRPVRVVLE